LNKSHYSPLFLAHSSLIRKIKFSTRTVESTGTITTAQLQTFGATAENVTATSIGATCLNYANNRPSSKDSISMHSPPPVRSVSAPLPMSKAARKAFLAAKQTKAMEKLDKMIEEANEVDSHVRTLNMRLINLGLENANMRNTSLEEAEDKDGGAVGGGGCPLFLPPPPPPVRGQRSHMQTSVSDSSICSHG